MGEREEIDELSAEMSKMRYDEKKEVEARAWMFAVTGEKLVEDVEDDEVIGLDRFGDALKDGVYLCKLINSLTEEDKIKIKTGPAASSPFQQMERIELFIKRAQQYGVRKDDLFSTPDLYDKQNLSSVLNAIEGLARRARNQGYEGPTFGPKEATAKERNFTPEQLEAGKNILGLQMGSNKGASQAGMLAGSRRDIYMKTGDKPEGHHVIGLQMGALETPPPKASSYGNRRDITSHGVEKA
ncbi:DgyrCDS9602 [Dimorphilus gyrociliatus]|uniref:Transgelin n=1 Tax=Dimorphilus gyrociliatus TaxID=2664684 RepID=A0A7I8VXV7_9ANNE|nr:DgyrCDS9602 [Dimorphilus gyrociliatus]